MTRSSSRQRNVPPPAGAGPAGAKAAMYARFIPREELSSFAAWSPGDLTGNAAGAAPAATAAGEAPHVDPAEQHANRAECVQTQLEQERSAARPPVSQQVATKQLE